MVENITAAKNNPGAYYAYTQARRNAIAILEAVTAAGTENPTILEKIADAIPEGTAKARFQQWLNEHQVGMPGETKAQEATREEFLILSRLLNNLDWVDPEDVGKIQSLNEFTQTQTEYMRRSTDEIMVGEVRGENANLDIHHTYSIGTTRHANAAGFPIKQDIS
ncbi:hypothetical protein B1757_12965 [Acidithiobacillus marinus]|uniref:Uncharacterized protein n=1 Tax=Acidithiobacillus marinus TaxID=187490 RepID=A0A2I1DIT7_9PROT|nr:hypothetical protein [Acidithiobacillus marinus]PKY09792.1 hypothetical protein B1757_12965 [Acidithiobacillus marinus]